MHSQDTRDLPVTLGTVWQGGLKTTTGERGEGAAEAVGPGSLLWKRTPEGPGLSRLGWGPEHWMLGVHPLRGLPS